MERTELGDMTIASLDESHLAKLRAAEKELGVILVALQPKYSLANLSKDQLRRIEALEKELGVVVLAYERR